MSHDPVTPDLMERLRGKLLDSLPIHWVGDAPSSLHGNGAASFTLTTRDPKKATCRLCLTLLARDSTGEETA